MRNFQVINPKINSKIKIHRKIQYANNVKNPSILKFTIGKMKSPSILN